MTKSSQKILNERRAILVDVVERGGRSRSGALRCEIGANLEFNTASLESYFFADWESVLHDTLLIAAAVEFCDKTFHRPIALWGRDFDLSIPVHDPDRWRQPSVSQILQDLLDFLTGDNWVLSFLKRKKAEQPPLKQLHFKLGSDVSAVIPFSNGLDSQAVAGLKRLELGQTLVLIRLQSSEDNKKRKRNFGHAFTAVPFSVNAGEKKFTESSARSRGFKFAIVSGLAAILSKAPKVILPESGQGALGPALIPVGQGYEDYRCHPLFTKKMENFFAALLNSRVDFEIPQLWSTKGETLKKYVEECKSESSSWISTRSCWQQNRHISVNGKARHCGVCAACMLRRLSVHAAGLTEPSSNYVWENLNASSFERGAVSDFPPKKITKSMKQYAIAGVLYLDHLAGLKDSSIDDQTLTLRSTQLSGALGISALQTRKNIDDLLSRHKHEWSGFLDSLKSQSYVKAWSRRA